jgi:glycosyltransferase involved in cell wall biosynthesis
VSDAAPAALAVVIPAYNASRTIAEMVNRCLKAAPGATLLVVDDGSQDDTAARALAAGAAVASHESNLGKGRALATGIAAATALPAARWVVTIDADGQHPPEAIAALTGPLARDEADLVIGARRRGGRMPMGRRLSNGLSSWLVSRGTGQVIPDSQCGFRAMTREVAERVRPHGARYEFETEFLFMAAACGYRIRAAEIPTSYSSEQSHFHYLSDTLRITAVFLRNWRSIV